jgi:phosphatidylserine decarboxylase
MVVSLLAWYAASMATTEQTSPSVLTAAPIRSIQPGGGLCMSLELAWGRWRRFWLRLLRPGYVRRMAEVRQGHCDGPHDVIDPRDLKYYRNVCGYWFRPEDDRFRWRGRLRLARAGLAELVCFSLLFLLLGAGFAFLGWWFDPWYYASLPLVAALWIFVISFFRDPERTIPTDPDVLVSPADGTVTHIDTVDDPDFPGGRAFRVSIFLSVFNVHVNRIPRTGRVVRLNYYPGAFLDARVADCAVRNEQFWIDIQDARTGGVVRVKQIAGAIARRIVCWLKPDEEVKAGDRLGMIKFGSRTELLLPFELAREVVVKVGDTVKGGSTVLLRLPPG